MRRRDAGSADGYRRRRARARVPEDAAARAGPSLHDRVRRVARPVPRDARPARHVEWRADPAELSGHRQPLSACRAARATARLRGIVVIDPARDAEQVAAWTPLGVRGIRLNLIGERDPDFADAAWRTLFPLLRAHGWQVELHAEAARLPALMPPLLDAGVDVSLDHFGRPDPRLGIDDPGFRYLLTTATSKRVWVKVSGAYRNDRADRWQASGLAAMRALRDAFGTQRLVWGSDWPHVGYEKAVDDALAYRYLATLLPDEAGRRQVLVDTPAALYRFDGNG
ncbi:amidohydrolase family protein [Burkholderia cenocepacia]|uniref:amidohydrolase family protein n=1 Tax=Burkholderia cenocepacia TaxID=95486 RepID=UPI001BA6EA23|nr:amidohydrolase family protein [Burkholderia cenocepacia]